MNTVLHGYETAAGELVARYEAIDCAGLYAPVESLFPEPPCRMVDVGAGTGRDAAWFAGRGYDVVAMEPVAAFRSAGARRHADPNIAWVDDRLPDLERLRGRGETFGLVLVSGVWQHIDDNERARAMPNIRTLMQPGAVLILSLRHGPGAPQRPCFPVSAQETIGLAAACGLSLALRKQTDSVQPQNRAAGVHWTWLGFTLPG